MRDHLALSESDSRAAFLEAERRRGGSYATKRDVDAYPGRWTSLRLAASGAPAVDVSGLDWDDLGDTWPEAPVPPGFYVARVSSQVDDKGNVEKQWVGARPGAPPGAVEDQLPEGHVVKGVSSYIADGQIRGQWVKTAKKEETREEVLRQLLAEIPELIPQRSEAVPGPKHATDADLLAVYPMGDPHVGMLAWGPEAGDHFDLGIAISLMRAAIDELTSHRPTAKKALIVNVGDFYHSDNPSNRTNRSGHSLDVDGRWFKVLRVGIDAMVYTVDSALRAHDSVRVVNAIGNHDDTSSLMLSVALDHHYRVDPRVEVVCSPAAQTYHRFGECLVGVTHGDTVKLGDLESLMAADRPEDWGETRWRYWYTGHVHHKRQQEFRGCMTESFRTLAAKDAWHAREGYRSGRDMNRIVLHKTWGEVGRSTVSAAYLQAQMRGAA